MRSIAGEAHHRFGIVGEHILNCLGDVGESSIERLTKVDMAGTMDAPAEEPPLQARAESGLV